VEGFAIFVIIVALRLILCDNRRQEQRGQANIF
jgi:hypothetical protein